MSALKQMLSIGSLKAEHPQLHAQAAAELEAIRALIEQWRAGSYMELSGRQKCAEELEAVLGTQNGKHCECRVNFTLLREHGQLVCSNCHLPKAEER